jgi:hypothetical protein
MCVWIMDASVRLTATLCFRICPEEVSKTIRYLLTYLLTYLFNGAESFLRR